MTTQVTPVQKSNDMEQVMGLVKIGAELYGKKKDKGADQPDTNPRDRAMANERTRANKTPGGEY